MCYLVILQLLACVIKPNLVVYFESLPKRIWLVTTNWWCCSVVEDKGCMHLGIRVENSDDRLSFYLFLLQLLLSYSATDCNLEGDLGNSPVILACSINNCEALSMLVCTETSGLMYSYSHPLYLHLSMCTEWIMLLWIKLTNRPMQPCLWQRMVSVCLSLHLFSYLSKIKRGVRLCQQNKLGHFAIHAAAFAGAKKAMEVILKAGMTKLFCRSVIKYEKCWQ